MPDFTVRPVESRDKDWVRECVIEQWGAETVVSRGAVHRPHELPGFLAVRGENRIGLITYKITGADCEIVSINSLMSSLGIGSALIEAVHTAARNAECKRLWLVATNDNMNALRFYQKRGFVLVAVHREALRQSRKLKPEIPLVGMDGIPLRDEIELEMRV